LPLGVDEAGWLQYAALAPTSEITLPLDVNNLTQVLAFFKRAHDQGSLSDAAASAKTVDETWNLFAAGQSPAAQIAASRYMIDRDKLPNAQFAAIPTRDGRIASVATGSALAIITKDPARQIAAAKVIAWLMQTERLAPWLRSLQRLPATRSAITATIDPPEYASFVRDHLERATLIPRTPAYNKISDAWRTILANLWRGQITPEDAARSMAATK
jgi:ABC-type glycerol-3-phosphate transport system substrate-binding protein